MKKWVSTFATFAMATLLALSAPTLAATADSAHDANQKIWLGSRGRFNSWRPVARDELILWATPSRPYLVKIWRPFTSLRFAHAIGVTTTAGSVTKFEYVIVDGQRLPIKSIVALDRETAKNLRWRSEKSQPRGAQRSCSVSTLPCGSGFSPVRPR